MQCPKCGSTELCLAYRVPMFAYLKDGQVTRAVVPDDPEQILGGVARCLVCDYFWITESALEVAWPSFQVESR